MQRNVVCEEEVTSHFDFADLTLLLNIPDTGHLDTLIFVCKILSDGQLNLTVRGSLSSLNLTSFSE